MRDRFPESEIVGKPTTRFDNGVKGRHLRFILLKPVIL